MRKIIHKLIRGATVFRINLQSRIYSFIFKIKLYYNEVECHGRVRVFFALPKLEISSQAKRVSIGDDFTIESYSDQSWYCKTEIYVREGAELIINDHVGLNGVMIFCQNKITIGNNASIGGACRIFDTDHHSLDPFERRDPVLNGNCKTAPVIIGDDVFIGTNSLILKGVTIGNRSVIGAGSVVTKDIPADEIWGGNPAKFIRKR